MTTLVMTYTVNPVWEFLRRAGQRFIESRERHGRAVAASHLAAMGYHKEARDLMLYDKK